MPFAPEFPMHDTRQLWLPFSKSPPRSAGTSALAVWSLARATLGFTPLLDTDEPELDVDDSEALCCSQRWRSDRCDCGDDI